MVLTLKSSSGITRVKKFLAKQLVKKKFDAKKFCGLLKVDEDALVIQQRLRNEWN